MHMKHHADMLLAVRPSISEKKKLSDAAVVKSKKNEDRLKGELDKLKEDLTKANNEGRTLANKVESHTEMN